MGIRNGLGTPDLVVDSNAHNPAWGFVTANAGFTAEMAMALITPHGDS